MAIVWNLEDRKRIYWYPSGQADTTSKYCYEFLIQVKCLWFKYRSWVEVYSVDAHNYSTHEDGINALMLEYKNRKKK